MTVLDDRFTFVQEWRASGEAWVARFCGRLLGESNSLTGAVRMAENWHDTIREV